MKVIRYAAIAATLFVTACGPTVAAKTPANLTPQQTTQIEGVVRESLIDPASATFRNIRAFDATLTDGSAYRYVCGEVNSKNRMGGYAGYSAFKGKYAGTAFVLEYVDSFDERMAYYSCMD